MKKDVTEMYSTYNQGKSVVAKRSIRTLETKIFKHMAAISKSAYFDVLDDIVNKYNNTVHRTIKIKPIDVTSDSYAEYNEGSNEKDMKTESQNMKTFLLKDTFQIGQKKFLLVKLKIQLPGLMLLVTWMVKKLLGVFTKKNCKKLVKKNLEWKKYLKEKVINCMSNGKGIIIVLIVGLIKKTLNEIF